MQKNYGVSKELVDFALKEKKVAEDFKKDLDGLCLDVFWDFDKVKKEDFREVFENLDLIISRSDEILRSYKK